MYLKSPYPDVPPLPDVNVHHFFFNRPDQSQWDDFVFHIDPVTGEKRKYREFVEQVYDLATALGAPVVEGGLGLHGEDGEIVGIMSMNCMDYPTVVQACLAITTPFSLISAHSTRFELNHALTVSKVTRLFVHTSCIAAVHPVAEEVGLSLDRIYVMGGHASGYKSLSSMIDDVRTKSIPRVEVRPATKNTLAYLVFSSGTSGLPKAVMISHGNVMYSLGQAMVHSKVSMEVYTRQPAPGPDGIPVLLGYLPMHHSSGLHGHCFRSHLAPGTLVILSKWDVETALLAIPKYKVSMLTLVPSMVHQLVHHPRIAHVDLSSVQDVLCVAAYLPKELGFKLIDILPTDAQFAEAYGLSEATLAAILQPFPGALGGRLKRIPACAGVLLPGMECRILRDDGSEADYDESGELWLKGENVALGYWNNEKATEETFVNGWLRTGDKFKVDKDGNFFFADRAKDTLKVSGSQVSPVEIENVLFAHPKKLISDCTVAGVSGGRTSDERVPRAWVVLSDSGRALGPAAVVQGLDEWHKENLSKYKWLRGGIEILDEIPKNTTGKTLRRVLQDSYENGVTAKAKL